MFNWSTESCHCPDERCLPMVNSARAYFSLAALTEPWYFFSDVCVGGGRGAEGSHLFIIGARSIANTINFFCVNSREGLVILLFSCVSVCLKVHQV